MRMVARVVLVLVVAMPVFAEKFVPKIFARHRPMHPDNAQAVTFEGTATADRIILSYERFTLWEGFRLPLQEGLAHRPPEWHPVF